MVRRPAAANPVGAAPVSETALGEASIETTIRDKASGATLRQATRVQQIVELIDHCTLAKETSDRLSEDFLSYLLAMAIQESRAALRRSKTI